MDLSIKAIIDNISIDESELSHALFQFIIKNFFDEDFDDAGCDWMTNEDCTKVYLGDENWLVSENPIVAKIVDTANFLTLGTTPKVMGVSNENN